ncbi:MAG: anaerobic ribonucleoside-triphosphate reductase activating protein [Muribaculaceae bacterium]|nr:anaerobic ribonucleoside-triphosphate reductase activating protein [Muribaculaceae bacterium]
MPTLKVLKIVEGTIVDGPGLRTTVYFAGCNHHCHGCHNPQSWDPENGRDMSVDEIFDIIEYNGFDVTFSGGEPLMQIENGLLELAGKIKKLGKSIWCYTGYTIEEIKQSHQLNPVLNVVDVLVDGPFVESLKDLSLCFRGSSNQRIINLKESE